MHLAWLAASSSPGIPASQRMFPQTLLCSSVRPTHILRLELFPGLTLSSVSEAHALLGLLFPFGQSVQDVPGALPIRAWLEELGDGRKNGERGRSCCRVGGRQGEKGKEEQSGGGRALCLVLTTGFHEGALYLPLVGENLADWLPQALACPLPHSWSKTSGSLHTVLRSR